MVRNRHRKADKRGKLMTREVVNWERRTGLKWTTRVLKLSRPSAGSTVSLFIITTTRIR